MLGPIVNKLARVRGSAIADRCILLGFVPQKRVKSIDAFANVWPKVNRPARVRGFDSYSLILFAPQRYKKV